MIAWDPTNWNTDVHAATSRMADLSPRSVGLIAGTRVATAQGWRDVATLIPGDRVLTFDGGLQTLVAVGRHALAVGNITDVASWPLSVPAGAIGNLQDLVVMPGQPVIVESDLAEEMYGDAFVALRGSNLSGVNGVTRMVPEADIEVVTLHFGGDQAVFVAGGGLALCEGNGCLLGSRTAGGQHAFPYRVLSQGDAEYIVMHGVAPAGADTPLTACAA